MPQDPARENDSRRAPIDQKRDIYIYIYTYVDVGEFLVVDASMVVVADDLLVVNAGVVVIAGYLLVVNIGNFMVATPW
jgi:hypothetical protein